jgi:hypothetical protein
MSYLRDFPRPNTEPVGSMSLLFDPEDFDRLRANMSEISAAPSVAALTVVVPNDIGPSAEIGHAAILMSNEFFSCGNLPDLQELCIRAESNDNKTPTFPEMPFALTACLRRATRRPIKSLHISSLSISATTLQAIASVRYVSHLSLVRVKAIDLPATAGRFGPALQRLDFELANDDLVAHLIRGLPSYGTVSVAIKPGHIFDWGTVGATRLPGVGSLALGSDGPCHPRSGPVWDDVAQSPIRELRVERGAFMLGPFERFCHCVETAPALVSLQLGGCTDGLSLPEVRRLFDAIARSNLKWLSMRAISPECALEFSKRLPSLRLEVISIGIQAARSADYGEKVRRAIVDGATRNPSIGAIRNPERYEYAKQHGIRGIHFFNAASRQYVEGARIVDHATEITADSISKRNQSTSDNETLP